VILGVGIGHREDEYAGFGVPTLGPSPRDEEGLAPIRHLLLIDRDEHGAGWRRGLVDTRARDALAATWQQRSPSGRWERVIKGEPPSVVKVFVRAKGVQRCVLVSDAVWLAGRAPGVYQFLSGPVELTLDRKVRSVGTQYLAGSVLDLGTAVANVIKCAGVDIADAIGMASRQPAMLLGRPDLGTLVPGSRADIVLARWPVAEGRLEVVQTIAGGEVVHAA